jgi:group I intron endonuclease
MLVYKIVNNINGKTYIGQTNDLNKRIAGHIRKDSTPIQKALNRYGLGSFTISVIDYADSKAVIDEKERYWIKIFRSNERAHGYNMTDGGEGNSNPSKKIRKKISKTLKKHYEDHEPTSGFTDHSHSEDTVNRIKQTLKKSFSLPEVKEKLGSGTRGKPKSEETKAKMSASGGHRKGCAPWNKGLDMYSIPGYVNPMTGKERPDLSERNRGRVVH